MTGVPPIADDILLKREFTAADPLTDPALVPEVPTAVTVTGILATYNHRKFKLPCAQCGAGQHHRGFLVDLSDGHRTLVGHHCGETVFGDAWAGHLTAFRALVDRQTRLRRAQTLVGG